MQRLGIFGISIKIKSFITRNNVIFFDLANWDGHFGHLLGARLLSELHMYININIYGK